MRPLMIGAAASLTILLGFAAAACAQTKPGDPKAPAPVKPEDKKKVPQPPPAKPPEKKAPPPVKKAPPPPAPAKPTPPKAPRTPGKPISEWSRATEGFLGDFWKELEDNGLVVKARYQDDLTRVQRGGINPHDSANRGWFMLQGTYDFHKVGLPEGVRVTAAFWSMAGENGTADAGSIHHVSPLESDHRKEFAEAYVEWDDFVDDMRLKVGKMDGTGEFASAALGADFMHMGRGYPPNIVGIPAWPDPAFGAALFYEPETGPYASAGVFDGASQAGKRTGERGILNAFDEPGGGSGVLEVGFRWKKYGRPVRLGVGGWKHTGDFPEFDGGVSDGTEGYYGVVEGQLLKKDRKAKEDPHGLWLLMRYSKAEEALFAIEEEYVAGAVWKGVCDARKEDSIGIALSHGNLSDDAAAGFSHKTERVLEGYYKVQATKFLSVSAGVQHIWNPGGNFPDALVYGFRLVIDF